MESKGHDGYSKKKPKGGELSIKEKLRKQIESQLRETPKQRPLCSVLKMSSNQGIPD